MDGGRYLFVGYCVLDLYISLEGSDYIKMHLVFTLIISIITVFIGLKSNMSFYIGIGGTSSNKMEALIMTLVFVLVYLLYGMFMGYKKKRGFLKFITLFWGLSAVMGLMGQSMLPFHGNPLKRAYAIIAIPIEMLTCIPTSGFNYFYPSPMRIETRQVIQIIVSMLSSWSAGALGYLLGYLLKKIRVKF